MPRVKGKPYRPPRIIRNADGTFRYDTRDVQDNAGCYITDRKTHVSTFVSFPYYNVTGRYGSITANGRGLPFRVHGSIARNHTRFGPGMCRPIPTAEEVERRRLDNLCQEAIVVMDYADRIFSSGGKVPANLDERYRALRAQIIGLAGKSCWEFLVDAWKGMSKEQIEGIKGELPPAKGPFSLSIPMFLEEYSTLLAAEGIHVAEDGLTWWTDAGKHGKIRPSLWHTVKSAKQMYGVILSLVRSGSKRSQKKQQKKEDWEKTSGFNVKSGKQTKSFKDLQTRPR
jgi:hypothetical protein